MMLFSFFVPSVCSEGAHAVVARLVGELGEVERFEQGWEIHAEPPAVTLAQAVPASNRVLGRTTPGLDRPVRRGLLLVGRAERHPVALLGEPTVQVVNGAQVIG